METIDKERSKASESRDIIEYFMEFQDGNTERLDSLRQGGEEGQLKVNFINIILKSYFLKKYYYTCRLQLSVED